MLLLSNGNTRTQSIFRSHTANENGTIRSTIKKRKKTKNKIKSKSVKFTNRNTSIYSWEERTWTYLHRFKFWLQLWFQKKPHKQRFKNSHGSREEEEERETGSSEWRRRWSPRKREERLSKGKQRCCSCSRSLSSLPFKGGKKKKGSGCVWEREGEENSYYVSFVFFFFFLSEEISYVSAQGNEKCLWNPYILPNRCIVAPAVLPVLYESGSDWAVGRKLGPAGDWDEVPNGRAVRLGLLRYRKSDVGESRLSLFISDERYLWNYNN